MHGGAESPPPYATSSSGAAGPSGAAASSASCATQDYLPDPARVSSGSRSPRVRPTTNTSTPLPSRARVLSVDAIDYNERTSVLPRCGAKRGAAATASAVLVLGLGVLFPLSWQTLPYSELGLDFNSITGALDTSKAYERGRHLVGIGHVFLRFPRTIQVMDFATSTGGLDMDATEGRTQLTSIPVITSDGQLVSVECSAWFRLVPELLGELYTRYATRYASNLAKAAREAVTEAASTFDTVAFYQARVAVRDAMREAVAKSFEDYPVEFVDLWLWRAEVPSRIDEAIEQKLLTEQLKRTMIYRQAATLVEEETATAVALTAMDETYHMQQAHAEALLHIAEAEARGINATTRALARGLADMSSGLDLHRTNAMRWLWWDTAKGAALRFITPETGAEQGAQGAAATEEPATEGQGADDAGDTDDAGAADVVDEAGAV